MKIFEEEEFNIGDRVFYTEKYGDLLKHLNGEKATIIELFRDDFCHVQFDDCPELTHYVHTDELTYIGDTNE